MANTRVNIDVNINTSDAARNLRQLQAQINSFQSALNTNNRLQGDASRYYSQQIKDLANQSGMFSAETIKMRTAASQLDQTLSKGQGTMRQFVSAKFLKDSAQAAQVLSLANSRASALQTQFVATGAAANGFREAVAIRPLQAFNSETAISAQKLAIHRAMLSQSTTSMINFGKNTQWAGRQLMVGFTVPLTIFAATAGKVFREIEKESLNFRKVYGDSFTTPEELNANLLAIQGLAKEYTKYGIAVKDTIGLAAQAAAAGSQGADLIDATTEATRLATLGQMDQNQALETTIALQTAFNLSGKDLSKTINFLNMVENQTVVTLQDLAQAIPRVAPVIKGLGGSVEDMAVMLAAMREGGITAAQGANALKSGLASLINPTDRAVESLDKMGINLTSIINMNRGDLLGTVKSFGEALASLDEFSRQQALEKVFGKFQYARLGALFNNIVKDGSQASRVMDTATMSAEQLAKSAEKELGAIEDSAATKFVAAMEKLKLAIAPIGEMFIQMATPVLGLLGSLVDKFNELPDFAKKFIGFGTVITGIIIPAGTMFLGLLMNLAGTLTKFGLVVGVAFKGFAQGGLKGSVEAVSQALNFMSLAEIDAATASSQLGTSTEIVNAALRDQVPAAAGADAAIDSLSRSYAALIVQMSEAAQLSRVAFVAPGAAMAGAAATGAEAGRRRGGPRIRRNSGGTIPGSGNTDTVPAMLTPGEFVVNKQATGENLALLHAINKGREVPGFNKGGQIPGMQYFAAVNPQRVVQQVSRFWNDDAAEFAGMFSTGSKRIIRSSDTPSETRRVVSVAFEDSVNNRLTSKQLSQLLGKPERTIQEAATSLGIEQMKLPGVSSQLVRAWKKEDVDGYLASLNLRAEKAHFGTKKATQSDIDAAIRLRGTGERAQFAKRLFDANIPVTALTDDWATFSSSLNQAANRGNTRINIKQAIDDILQNKNILELGPAITNAGISKEKFLTSLVTELRNKNGEEIFTDTILTNARNDALKKLGKSIIPNTTGLRIPAKADLQEIVAPLARKTNPEDVTFDDINKYFLNKKGFEILSAKDTGTGYSAIKEKASGKFEKLAASTGYNNGGMIPMLGAGGIALAANAARSARGRIPANIVDWFSKMTTSINQSNRDDMLQNIPANIKRGLSTSRKKFDITRGSVDPIDGGTLKEVSSWSRGQGVGRFMESSKLFETMNNSKFQIAQRSQSMKRDIDWLKSLGPDGPHPMQTWSQFHKANGGLSLRLTPEEIQESGGVIWKANKKKLEKRIQRDQEFIAGHQKIIDDLRESNIPTIYKTSVKKGEKYFDVSGRIVPKDDQRLNNPAASNAILEEKEVALLGARLTGKAKSRIVEREEAQARYDKAKEEIKRLRTAIFNQEMSAEKAKPDLDRLYDETENMAAFVNWGRGREVSYPNVVSKLSTGGILPQMRNIGGEIFDSTKTSRTIVPGVGNKDTVPAALTPGEFVINKDATRKNLDLLRAVNNGTIRGYAEGGKVVKIDGKYMVEGPDNESLGPYNTRKEAERGYRQFTKEKAREATRRAKQSRTTKGMMGGRGMGASMGVGALGGAMMMSPMIPGIGQNEGLSSALSSGGMALSLLSILPMMGQFGVAIGAIAVPLTAATIAFKLMRENIDKVAQEATIAGQNIGGAAGRMEELSAATGYQFSLSKSQSRMFRFTDQQAQDASQFSDYFEGEKGQGFVKELKDLSSEKRYKKVASIIAQGVADGMDPKTAQAYGNAIAAYTNDAILKARLSTDFKKGKFSSGTQALVDLLKERESAVSKETTSMGQLKEVNLSGAGQLASDALNLDGANAQFANLTATVAAFVGLPIFGPMIGLGVGLLNFNKEMDKVEENTKIVATSFGGSLEVLKEVANAETAISEARRNNIITEQQAAQQLLKVREVEESATNRLRASLTELQTGNVDAPGVQQGLKNALILNSGFDEAQASAVVETMNFKYVAEQLFPTKDVEEIKADPAYSQAVVAVIADTLSGITPENAGQKIADIQSQYAKIAEAIVQAGVDGMSAVEIRGLVTEASSADVAKNALEGMSKKDLTEAETISDPTLRKEARERAKKAGAKVRGRGMPKYFVDPESGIKFEQNAATMSTPLGSPAGSTIPGLFNYKAIGPIDEASKSFGKLTAESGLASNEVAELNARFAELSNFDLAVNISESKEEFTRFSGMVRELSKFPGIDIEVMMQTETGQDPIVVAKKIEDTIKRIGDINFKKSFGKNWKEMSAASTMLNPQEFITMSRKIQKAMDPTSIFKPEEVTEAYKETLSDLDKLRDNFKGSFDKESGILKKVQVEMIPTVFDENVENAQAIADALNDALPNGFNPILLPIMAQLMMDPKLAAIMQNPGNMANFAEYVNSGGTTDKGYSPSGSTADSMEGNGGQKTFKNLGITLPNIPGSIFGGGGSGSGPVGGGQKSLIQQLKDQFKSLQDIYEGYAKNISKKTGMFKGIAAGPFGQQFIDYLISQGDEGIKIFKEKGKKYNQAYKEFVKVQIQAGKNFMKQLPSSLNQQRLEIKGQKIVTDQLAEQGFSASGIERIVSAAPEGEMAAFAKAKAKLAKAKAKKNRGEKLTEEDKLTKDQKAIVSKYSKESTKKSLIPSEKLDKEERNQLVQSKEDAFELEQALSGALGKDIDPQVIDTLKEMGYTAEEVAANYDEISKYAQRLNDVLTQTSFTDQMKDLSTETDNAQRALKLMGQGIPADIANQIANMGNSANFSADQIQDLANTMQQLKILKLALQDPAELRLQQMMNQERINQLNYEIGLIESVNANEKMAAEYVKEKVTNHEDLLAVYERQNDAKSREIELRQRDLEPLDEQIEKLEEQKTKIEENYDAQSEALDEVIEKENELFAIKAKSLDVAGALSRGDVAGAAKAALELEKELSQQRSQDQRQILDQQRKLSIEAVDTRIKTLADQKKVIEQDILRLQKEQRAIQDKIYNAQLIINNEAARLEGIYKLGNNQVALLKQELILAEQEQRDLNAAVQAQIDLMKELGRIPRNKTSDSESSTDSESGAVDNTNTETSMNVPTPSAPTPSAPASRPSTPTPTTPKPPPPPTPPPTPTADRLARPQEAALEAQRQAAIQAGAAQDRAKAAANAAAIAAERQRAIDAAAAQDRAKAAANAAATAKQRAIEAGAAQDRAKAAAAAAAKAAEARAAEERAKSLLAQGNRAAAARAANRAFGGFISKYAMGGRVGYKGSTERAPGMMYGGSAKKYAYGSTVPGRGMTDKVPALLTPGEFVVRKRVAEQYGPLLESLNGQVFPKENFDKDMAWAGGSRDFDESTGKYRSGRVIPPMPPVFPIPKKPDMSIIPMPNDEYARRKRDMDMMGATKEKSHSSLIDAVKNASRGELDKLLAISNQNSKDRVRLGVEPNRFNTGNLTGRLNDFRAMSNQKVFPTMKTNSFNSSSKTEKSGSMYNYNVNVTLNGSDMDANDVANAVIQKIKMTENKGIRSNNIRG